ncbi:50S ribosomal protein l21 [Globisporangium polare]
MAATMTKMQTALRGSRAAQAMSAPKRTRALACMAPSAAVTSARLFSSGGQEAPRTPLPPFTRETAALKVRAAEDAWNTRNPARVAQAYTIDSAWRNRSEFVNGRKEIEAFLTRKWEREREYRLIKELFAFDGNRIAVRFAYEWLDGSNRQWFRAYGNENWEFDAHGYMAKRFASINDVAIGEHERKFHWQQGRRPDSHPSLSDLGL